MERKGKKKGMQQCKRRGAWRREVEGDNLAQRSEKRAGGTLMKIFEVGRLLKWPCCHRADVRLARHTDFWVTGG